MQTTIATAHASLRTIEMVISVLLLIQAFISGCSKCPRGEARAESILRLAAQDRLSNVEGSSEAIQAQRRLWAFSAACYGKFVSPIRYRSHSRAAPLPSLIAQTTRLWPRRQSPAATTATVPVGIAS